MIRLICIGKIKEDYLKEAIKEYAKRISKYSKLEIIECKDYEDSISTSKEESEILSLINQKDYIILLDIKGEDLTSEQFSNLIDKAFITNPNITFIIGGSNGISDNIRNVANKIVSFSRLTFPHQLFRVILLEQIYRAFKIINNETYHK